MSELSHFGLRSLSSGLLLFAGLILARPSFGFSVAGVEISDFMVIDLGASSNLSLSTTGDIYLLAPLGLSASAVSLIADRIIVSDLPMNVSGTFSLCDTAHCAPPPPSYFQDVVIRVNGLVGVLDLASNESIVVDTVPIPEPTTATLLLGGILLLARERRSTLIRLDREQMRLGRVNGRTEMWVTAFEKWGSKDARPR